MERERTPPVSWWKQILRTLLISGAFLLVSWGSLRLLFPWLSYPRMVASVLVLYLGAAIFAFGAAIRTRVSGKLGPASIRRRTHRAACYFGSGVLALVFGRLTGLW
jgi:hypothetical protein